MTTPYVKVQRGQFSDRRNVFVNGVYVGVALPKGRYWEAFQPDSERLGDFRLLREAVDAIARRWVKR